MGHHVWRREPEDPDPNVWWDPSEVCTFCGLHRGIAGPNDEFSLLPYLGSSRSCSFVRFSTDCDVAQEQVRFYLLGWLQSAAALQPTRYGNGVIGTMRTALIELSEPFPYIVQAFLLLERAPGVLLEDLQWELKGGRPKPTEPPLDVEL